MSVWADIQDRSAGEQVRKEDQESELKKTLDSEVKKFIDEYVGKVFQSGCSLEIVKYCCRVALPYLEDFCIVERLDKKHQDLYYEMIEEWDLESYLYKSIKTIGEEIVLNLKEEDRKTSSLVRDTKVIDYSELRELLKYQTKLILLCSDCLPWHTKIPLINDLDRRTMRIFKYIQDELGADAELNILYGRAMGNLDVDDFVDRLIELLSKYDGTYIPAPYDDIDDWWGDFNGTINYLVQSYKDYM